jgi:gliding motility-associated-like protein
LASNPGFYPDGSWSNEVEVIQETRLRFPDTFTPNEDGINDFFQCYGLFLKSFELVVYNSWGNIVFSSNNSGEFWNGKIDGLPAPTGNYAYRVIATDEAGERLEKSGFFALIR